MHRIDSTNSVAGFPAPAGVGPGVAGYFRSAGVNGAPFTVLTADWANAVQGEIVAVVESAGIALSKASQVQLLAAIRSIAGGAAYRRGVGTGTGTQPGDATRLTITAQQVVINSVPLAHGNRANLDPAPTGVGETGLVLVAATWYYMYAAKTAANALYASPILSAVAPEAAGQRASAGLNHTIGGVPTAFAAADTLYLGAVYHVAAGSFREQRRIGSAVYFLEAEEIDEVVETGPTLPDVAVPRVVAVGALVPASGVMAGAHVNALAVGAASVFTVRVGVEGYLSTAGCFALVGPGGGAAAAAGSASGFVPFTGGLAAIEVSWGHAGAVPATYHYFLNLAGYEEPLL